MSEEEEEEGSEKIKWRSLRGLLLVDVFRLCVVMCEELLGLWKSPLNLRGIEAKEVLHGHNAGSHEGATVSKRRTINSGLPHNYLHENLISLFSATKESSSRCIYHLWLSFCLPYPHHPRKFIMEVMKMHS